MKTVTAYEFDDLGPAARDKAIETCRYFAVEDNWWSSEILSEWGKKLHDLGYERPKIGYSGFYCQGDGASFTATVNLATWLDRHDEERFDIDDVSVRIIRVSHREVHEYSVNAQVEGDTAPTWLEGNVINEVRRLSREIYQDLKREYEYETSDEVVAEHIRDREEYLFTETGTLLPGGLK